MLESTKKYKLKKIKKKQVLSQGASVISKKLNLSINVALW